MVGATAVMSNIRPPRTATTQAVLRRLAPDTADQQSAVQVGGQVMIGNSGSSHAGSLGPSFVRSWSGPRRDAPGTASESRAACHNVQYARFLFNLLDIHA